jgi:hypothetical protein
MDIGMIVVIGVGVLAWCGKHRMAEDYREQLEAARERIWDLEKQLRDEMRCNTDATGH